MEKIREKLKNFFKKETSFSHFFWVFLASVTIRVFIEQFLARTTVVSVYEVIIEHIHNLFFFLIAFLSIWIFLSFLLGVRIQMLTQIFSWASLLVFMPPVFDLVKTGGEVFWSFYVIGGSAELWRNFWSIFGDLPSGIVYFGTRIVFVSVVIFVFLFVFLWSGKIKKAFLGAFGTYLVLFLLGAFPSLLFLVLSNFYGLDIADVKAYHIAQFFGSPQKVWGIAEMAIKYAFAWKLDLVYYPTLIFLLALFMSLWDRAKFFAVLANLRLPQTIYHIGIFFIGMGLAVLKFPQNFQLNFFSFASVGTLLLAVVLAWKASIIPNDIYDLEIDKISNPDRPLPKKIFTREEYVQFGWLCFFLSLLGGLVVGFEFFSLLLVYQIIAWMYSAEPLRIKKYLGLATFVSSLASILILFLGYILVSKNQSIENLSWRIILLLIFSYTVSIPAKDFKDIEGDGKYGVWTAPVVFGEKNGRLVVGTGMFLSFMASVFFLNEMKLFFWALLFGVSAFLIVNSKNTKPRQMYPRVLLLVAIYTIILAKVVFL